jgi:DNA-binding NarL/FixJ family response regulator
VSKQRPSRTIEGIPRAALSADYWRSRVFKNTFTRGGQLIALKSWSVKLQHNGTRRTLSLAARHRSAAAIEAQALYQMLRTQGWEAVQLARRSAKSLTRADTRIAIDSFPKTDPRYWKNRLLRRPHLSRANSSVEAEFSVRIEHAGVAHYFPLGTLDEAVAAEKARENYLAVVKDGWDAVNRKVSRELTIGIHWIDTPVAWTYATIHSLPTRAASRFGIPGSQNARQFNVAILESDAGIRTALTRCINSQSGFRCDAAFAKAGEMMLRMRRLSFDLVLAACTLSELTPGEFVEKLRRIAPNLPVLFFSTYQDSNQLFTATPGGAAGYLLKRTRPDCLLDPLIGAQKKGTLSPQTIAASVRDYFRRVTDSLFHDGVRGSTRLTHREHEIMELLSKGYLDKEIAEELSISIWTVHGHLKRIFEKLGVHTRTEAAMKYFHK